MSDHVPVYQYHEKDPYRFFFSINADWRHWKKDGVAFRAYKNQVEGTIPVYQYHAEKPYRFVFSTYADFGHSWKKDSVAFYAYENHVEGTIPVYQYHSKDLHRYFLSTNADFGHSWRKVICQHFTGLSITLLFASLHNLLVTNSHLQNGNYLGKYPATDRVLHQPVNQEEHRSFEGIKDIPPEDR